MFLDSIEIIWGRRFEAVRYIFISPEGTIVLDYTWFVGRIPCNVHHRCVRSTDKIISNRPWRLMILIPSAINRLSKDLDRRKELQRII